MSRYPVLMGPSQYSIVNSSNVNCSKNNVFGEEFIFVMDTLNKMKNESRRLVKKTKKTYDVSRNHENFPSQMALFVPVASVTVSQLYLAIFDYFLVQSG